MLCRGARGCGRVIALVNPVISVEAVFRPCVRHELPDPARALAGNRPRLECGFRLREINQVKRGRLPA